MYQALKRKLITGVAIIFRAFFGRAVDFGADRELARIENGLRAQRQQELEDTYYSRYAGPWAIKRRDLMLWVFIAALMPQFAHAADLEQTFRNLVQVLVGRLLPVLSLGYLGKNIFSHIQGDPNAKQETIRVVIAIACLIGINGAWNLISQQVR